MNAKEIGIKGEEIAMNYLQDLGYEILEINWRFRHKEIDIIAEIDNILCVIEVKTRSSNYLPPKDAVNIKKQNNLILAINAYLTQNNIDKEVRFDVIEILLIQENIQINHLIDAFSPLL